MTDFTDDNKAVKEFSDSNRLGFGVHKVKIALFELDTTDTGKEYLEISVLGDHDEEESARVWFTSDAAKNYSFNVLRQIYVHNAPEAKKDEARQTMDAVSSTEELAEKLSERLIGAECWFTKYVDPARTYQAADGSTRKSVNKNVYGYEPRLRLDLMPKDDSFTSKDLDDIFPNEKADTQSGIPREW